MAPPEAPSVVEEAGSVGIYTKTVVRSPAVRWIIHARIRHRRLNDVIFVGEDFIEVKSVGKEGQLLHVATKTDFGARIRAATSFHHSDDSPDEDFLLKLEREAAAFEPDAVPPQSIVLTLDSNDLVFVFLRLHDDGSYRFAQQICPLPSFDRILFQPGEHLTVDPYSRAIAVGANEREVILYSVKPKDQIQHEIKAKARDWCPVSQQKPMQVEGVIQHMDFLIPPTDDTDHIVLLLIVVDHNRTKAIRIDWHYSSGPRHAQKHPGQALESSRKVTNLLIPLQEAAFLLVSGNEVTLWRNILSGSATDSGLEQPIVDPRFPGVSAYAPVWASWTKPRRSQAARSNKDFIYLAREDGLVLLIVIPKTRPTSLEQSVAGHLDCHVGTAFASLGDEGDPDILCVAGSAGSGKVVSIGNFPSSRRIEEMSRQDTMNMDDIEILPNWASATDMISTDVLHASRARSKDKDSIMITSGKQPFGTITEIRTGIEAQLSVYLELEGLRSVVDAWVLPGLSLGTLILVLSSPDSTQILTAGADFDSLDGCEDGSAFDVGSRTLAAGLTGSGHLVQVTQHALCATTALQANFEDTLKFSLPDGCSVLASSIVSSASVIVTAEKSEDGHTIACYSISSNDEEPVLEPGPKLKLPGQPLSVNAVQCQHGILAMTGTHDSRLAVICFRTDGTPTCRAKSLPTTSSGPAICDSIAILRAKDQLVAVCGLRDGRLVTMEIDLDSNEIFGQEHVTTLGHSTVNLVPLSSDGRSAIAMTGENTYLLSWPGGDAGSLSCENIWMTDKARPELQQGAIAACAQMPSASLLSSKTLADAVMMISEDSLYIASLDRAPSTVPRQIPVSSTPNRLVYADTLKQTVCCGLVTEVRKLPSRPQNQLEEKRQVWPRLEFIPTNGTEPTFGYDMQPGERVNAILPWTLRVPTDKTYSHILVGGSYVRSNGKRRGKVAFLQPLIKRWEVSEVRVQRTVLFEDDVYSMALYDDTTYIACAGDSVHIERFSVAGSKWDKVCSPFKMASPGVHITVVTGSDESKIIVISTNADSLITLRLLEQTGADGNTTNVLAPVATGPRADLLISHLVIPTPGADDIIPSQLFSLASTKYGNLIGMTLPADDRTKGASHVGHRSGAIRFEAQLPRSLTRMVRSPPPVRKGPTPSRIISERMTGSATDGAIVNFTLIDPHLWQQLFWLQRLIEWSETLSPHTYSSPPYGRVEGMTGECRALPIGFEQPMPVILSTNNSRLNDYHIDGDTLARALHTEAIDAIKHVLEEVSQKDDAVGNWLRPRLNAELDAVDEAIELVRKIDAWI